ncbi:MAG: dephospho-CoA kinase [Propionibacteriaceae bacterium]|nr:dephospho-CoA kinase [Propionibacteriaceae bacterium]
MRVGVTGGIASGKSLVAQLLADRGAAIIDADVLAREAVAPGTPGLRAVVERFGEDLVDSQGRLDRARLASLVFADPQARADLNAIVHPRVRARAAELEAAADPGAVVVHVIPLLVETGQQESFDEVIVVDVPERTQLERLMARDGLSREDALSRIAAQASRAERRAAATRIVDNSGTRQNTVDQVGRLASQLGLTGSPSGVR